MSFDPGEAAALGEVIGETSDVYAERWDARDDFEGEVDLGWIGEDARGVWIAVHPLVAVHEFPSLWDQIARFSSGLQDITESDWTSLSAYEFDAKLTLACASNRKIRRMSSAPKGGPDDDD